MRSLTVQIPQPCHERWDDMQPTERGRFCASCQKKVVDYTAFSDQELVRLLAKAPETSCGRFRNEQLNRPLLPSNSNTSPIWQHWLSLLTMGLFGWQTAKAQLAQSNPSQSVSMRQTPVLTDYAVTPLPARPSLGTDENWTISGRVMLMDSSGNESPLSKAYVTVIIPYNDPLAKRPERGLPMQTDNMGAFTLQFPMQRQAIELTILVSASNARLHERIVVTASPSTKSIRLNDIILHQQIMSPRKDITGGGLMVIRESSRWQKLKRKLFR
jgi:hypothetical protein